MKTIREAMTKATDRVIQKLAGLIPAMSFLVARRQRLYAERESAMMLELYRGVRSAHQQLSGSLLYETIVAHRLGCDEAEAREIVRHARESYAIWPDDRNLTFRDVVHYVIVHHLIDSSSGFVGTLADTEQTVRAAIPGEL